MQRKTALRRLELTAVKPEGWLLDQLKVQMNGLSGKLYEIWDSVGSYSGWLGGTGESWERAPYYLDGLLPLAYYLQDEKQLAICRRFIDWTLESQDERGNFGPEKTKDDYWSRYVMLKVLVQHWEITKDVRVIPFFRKYFRYITAEFAVRPPELWSSARIADLLYCLKWLYEVTGDESLLEMAPVLEKDAICWTELFENFPFTRPTGYYFNWDIAHNSTFRGIDQSMRYSETHVVNVTMGLKYPAMQYYFDSRPELAGAARRAIDTVTRYHGVASGTINGDEHISGPDPSQGSELCAVVEYMFSLLSLAEVFGDPFYGDQLERLAFNALPATFTDDMMGHQYLQQANQVLVDYNRRNWYNNSPDSNLFGLEPHFGCCTANMHQGWPKLADALWYQAGEDTLVSMVFAPSSVTVPLNGGEMSVRLATEYPFRSTLRYEILKAPAGKAKIKIRVPGWCRNMKAECAGSRIAGEDGFITVEKEFSAGDVITAELPMEVRFTEWPGGGTAVERGPLVFGLAMQERWEVFRETCGVKDWCIYPESPWNYALQPESEGKVSEQPLSSVPFSRSHPPVVLELSARRAANWQLEKGSAGKVPEAPDVAGAEEERIQLIPFGSTMLRVSQFPVIGKK